MTVEEYSNPSTVTLSLRYNVIHQPFVQGLSKELCLIYAGTLENTLDISYGMSR